MARVGEADDEADPAYGPHRIRPSQATGDEGVCYMELEMEQSGRGITGVAVLLDASKISLE